MSNNVKRYEMRLGTVLVEQDDGEVCGVRAHMIAAWRMVAHEGSDVVEVELDVGSHNSIYGFEFVNQTHAQRFLDDLMQFLWLGTESVG